MPCKCRTRVTLSTNQAPKAFGPYSVGVRAGHFIYTAGQVGLDPATGTLVEGGVEAETRQVLNNLKVVLEAGGRAGDTLLDTKKTAPAKSNTIPATPNMDVGSLLPGVDGKALPVTGQKPAPSG